MAGIAIVAAMDESSHPRAACARPPRLRDSSRVIDHLLVAGLTAELAGVALLAKSLAVGDVEDYVVGTEQEYGRSLTYRDVARARDQTEAGVGLALIFVGVAGQVVHALHWRDIGLWWYAVLAAALGLAALGWWRLGLWRQRQVVSARLRARVHGWWVTVDDYELALRKKGQVVGDVLAEALGRRWWERLRHELEQTATAEKAAVGTAGEDSDGTDVSRQGGRRAFDRPRVASLADLRAAADATSVSEVLERLTDAAEAIERRAGGLMTAAAFALTIAALLAATDDGSPWSYAIVIALAFGGFLLALTALTIHVGAETFGPPPDKSDVALARGALIRKERYYWGGLVAVGLSLTSLALIALIIA